MYTPFVRKYAIRFFDDVIGQPIVVKVLKNTLFLDHVFSVYLFAGKHGCGKTSTARLFSMALNCEQLPFFRKNPQEKIPCQSCKSCVAMSLMQHPDFIEIDAASHTGVDNVRLLIESATLLPLLGKKKIYLIDEAHMLSKAACNAFLKILEEPPKDVVFILATTAPEKILETVRSRCFQLFFDAISDDVLINLLCLIAKNEQVDHTREGIARIVSLSKGSVRDSLNMLDQTRLATRSITVESLNEIFGKCSDDDIISFFDYIFCKKSKNDLLSFFQKIVSSDQSTFHALFDRIIFCARVLLWFLYGQKVNTVFIEKLALFNAINPTIVMQFLSHLYQHETALRRSEQPVLFFEILVLLFLEKNNNTVPSGVDNYQGIVEQSKQSEYKNEQFLIGEKKVKLDIDLPTVPTLSSEIVERGKNNWDDFLQLITAQQDPLLLSIFKQGVFQSFDSVTNCVTVLYSKDRSFFADIIADGKKDWGVSLQKIFGTQAMLNTIFSSEIAKNIDTAPKLQPEQSTLVHSQQTALPAVTLQNKSENKKTMYTKSYQYQPKNFAKPAKIVDVTDTQKWQYANLLKRVFPGVITEIEKGDS